MNPSPSSTSGPSTLPSLSPSFLPSASPSRSPTIAPSKPTITLFRLTTNAITSGGSIAIEESEGDVIAFTISPVAGASDGGLPYVAVDSGTATIQTFGDTHGVYEITAQSTVNAGATQAKEFVVLPDSEMDTYLAGLSSTLNGMTEVIGALASAVDSDDIQQHLNELKHYRNDVDIDVLPFISLYSLDDGFLPSQEKLDGAGFEATTGDEMFSSVALDLVKNFVQFKEALDNGDATPVLDAINEEALKLVQDLEESNPSIYGIISAQFEVDYLVAYLIPNLIHAIVDTIEKELDGSRRRMSERSLAVLPLLTAVGIRGLCLRKVYTKQLVTAGKLLFANTAVLALGSLLDEFVGNDRSMTVMTNNFSIHPYGYRNSIIEVVPAAKSPYPEMYKFFLVGPDVVNRAIDAITVIYNTGKTVQNLREAFEYMKSVRDALQDEADVISQTPDEIRPTCYNHDSDCVTLQFDDGFEDPIDECNDLF
eukprot:scaffold1392_cov86-Skeletonema_menzelii.AAC.1